MAPPKKGFNEYKIVDDYVILYDKKKDGRFFEIQVDLKNLEKLKDLDLYWCASYKPNIDNYYACATQYLGTIDGKPRYKTIYLHRTIFGLTEKMYVDHISMDDTLNNRESNLRILSNTNNLQYRNGKNKNNQSGYRNVCWDNRRERWIIQLQIDGKNKVLGYFKDVHEAGRVAEEMRQKYYGKYAGLGQ